MTKGQAEAGFRDAMIRVHKEVTGKGPKDVYVKIRWKCRREVKWKLFQQDI